VRYPLVDITRGIAFVAMVVYHTSWFADDYGLVDFDMHGNLAWVVFQKSIAGTFFFLVGSSLYLAHRDGVKAKPMAWRMGKLALCAAVITATSIVMNPGRIVTFGILHCIVATSVVGLVFLRVGKLNIGIGALLIAIGIGVRSTVFDTPALYWIGLGTEWIPTFDFQPFLPWFGVVILGISAGQFAWPHTRDISGDTALATALTGLGRWALWLYMAHVPAIIATMELLRWAGFQGEG
jgi:uncharacterized membrane protein